MSQVIFAGTWSFGALAVNSAYARWQQAGDLSAATIAGAAAVEMDPTIPTVGRGGLPNRRGVMELDAAYMRGDDLRCGAVAALRATLPAIEVAHKVATTTDHVMLAGTGADEFALANGFAQIDLLTDQTRKAYDQWRKEVASGKTDEKTMVGHDTVGVLGWSAGRGVACVSTSGLGWKMPGRVGDSPIIGAGLYADDQVGCVACTGVGEEIWRFSLAVRVIDAMARGLSPDEAGREVMQAMLARYPQNAKRGISLLAIRADGRVGAATTRTTNHVFEYHVCRDGQLERIEPDPVVA